MRGGLAVEWQEVLKVTRRLNSAAVQDARFHPDYVGILEALGQELGDACAAVIDNSGELLSIASTPDSRLIEDLPQIVLEELVSSEEPKTISNGESIGLPRTHALICPILGGTDRLGALLVNDHTHFEAFQVFLVEYTATLLGLIMLQTKVDKLEDLVRQRSACQVALSSLSFSEQQAMRHILQQLSGFEGMIVTSKVAEDVGITRSIIVNGLRKLESAGLLESRSLGMKGTYVRLLNDLLPDELDKALGIK